MWHRCAALTCCRADVLGCCSEKDAGVVFSMCPNLSDASLVVIDEAGCAHLKQVRCALMRACLLASIDGFDLHGYRMLKFRARSAQMMASSQLLAAANAWAHRPPSRASTVSAAAASCSETPLPR